MYSGRGGRKLVALYGVWSLIYWSLLSQGSFCEHLSCQFLHWTCKHLIWKVNSLPGSACNNSQAILWVAMFVALFPVTFFQQIVNSTSMTNLHSLSQLQNNPISFTLDLVPWCLSTLLAPVVLRRSVHQSLVATTERGTKFFCMNEHLNFYTHIKDIGHRLFNDALSILLGNKVNMN